MDGENEKTDKPEANIPPKLDLKQAVSASSQPKKATTRIDMASAAMIPEEKSKTTRINLGAFTTDTGAPKTIKIQRPSEAATIKLNRPGPAPAATPAAPPLSQAQAKRQTSRISLQEAFVAPAEGQTAAPTDSSAPSGGPKTIRIKRPGDSGGAPAQESIPAPAPSGAPSPEPGLEAGPPTQRKTIKLRRPGGGEGEARHSPTLPKAAADFAAAQAAGPAADTDEPGVIFAVVSLVAVLVCCVMVYMLCAQALPSLGLTWPGQVATLR